MAGPSQIMLSPDQPWQSATTSQQLDDLWTRGISLQEKYTMTKPQYCHNSCILSDLHQICGMCRVLPSGCEFAQVVLHVKVLLRHVSNAANAGGP